MKYRTLGKSNLKVSVIGIGTWQLGGEWGKNFTVDEVIEMLGKARELGVNLIDTAECYGDHTSESLIGSAIASGKIGKREDWIIATKFGHTFHGHMDRTDDRSASDVTKQLDLSLKSLRTDYIDLYQYHSIRDTEFANPELRAFLAQAKQSGKVRHIGNSIANSGNADGRVQVDGSTDADVEAIQIVYNRLERKHEDHVLGSCAKQNLGVLARVPLASGLLSGKYNDPNIKPDSFSKNDVRSSRDAAKFSEQIKEVEQIAKTEVPPGVEMSQWALAWCLLHPAVTCVIPGCKSVKQVIDNAKAADLTMVESR